ncbi:MAG: hypothetical protein AABY32_00655 [Nanoarchaeota archaeon]
MSQKTVSNINNLLVCPECKCSWDDGPIPEKDRDNYSYPYRFSRLIGIEYQGEYDGISAWQCPDCKTIWNRFSGEKE